MDESLTTASVSVLEGDIQRFETPFVGALSFSPEFEDRFHRECASSRCRNLFLHGLIALLAYDFFIVGDYLMAPEHIDRALITRFGVVTPITLILAFLARRNLRPMMMEVCATALCLLGAASILFLHHGVSPTVSVEAQTGLAMVLLVSNCLLRLDFAYATVLTSLIFCMEIAFLARDPFLQFPQRLFSAGMMGWISLLALVANYMLLREYRLAYLLRLRDRIQRSALAGANAELLALSSTDRLTGLPNRRAYDTQLAEVWQDAIELAEPVSAVMIDVDHFKKLNDTHGHAYGDRVLQRVAMLLQQALRGDRDFVARFGGEEFVVLLPNSDPATAHMVAERIRTLVQVAGSPALHQGGQTFSPQDMWATVSCGVSTAWPAVSGDPASLITEADAALYRAKRTGRNRVCCGASEPPANPKVAIFPGMTNRA